MSCGYSISLETFYHQTKILEQEYIVNYNNLAILFWNLWIVDFASNIDFIW